MTGTTDSALRELLDADARVERLATGFTFTEGPVWHKSGGYLLFSDMPGDVRRSWSAEAGVVEVMRPSYKGNGMVYDTAGNLLVCEHVTSSLVRELPDGRRETVASHFEGKQLNSPNDVCVRSDGTIYFSDPTYGRLPGFGVERECELDWSGVYILDGPPDRMRLRLAAPKNEFGEPNGLCFSPDESTLFVNDTPRAHIKAFDVAADGSLSNGRIFYVGIGDGVVANGVVDGMKCDERGNVWVTGPGGVWVIDPRANMLGVLEVPENVGNLTWGDTDWRTLFLASSTSLYRIRTRVASARLPYH